jgi:hypothetical protein
MRGIKTKLPLKSHCIMRPVISVRVKEINIILAPFTSPRVGFKFLNSIIHVKDVSSLSDNACVPASQISPLSDNACVPASQISPLSDNACVPDTSCGSA